MLLKMKQHAAKMSVTILRTAFSMCVLMLLEKMAVEEELERRQ